MRCKANSELWGLFWAISVRIGLSSHPFAMADESNRQRNDIMSHDLDGRRCAGDLVGEAQAASDCR
jgi:hypothetical protein